MLMHDEFETKENKIQTTKTKWNHNKYFNYIVLMTNINHFLTELATFITIRQYIGIGISLFGKLSAM